MLVDLRGEPLLFLPASFALRSWRSMGDSLVPSPPWCRWDMRWEVGERDDGEGVVDSLSKGEAACFVGEANSSEVGVGVPAPPEASNVSSEGYGVPAPPAAAEAASERNCSSRACPSARRSWTMSMAKSPASSTAAAASATQRSSVDNSSAVHASQMLLLSPPIRPGRRRTLTPQPLAAAAEALGGAFEDACTAFARALKARRCRF